MGHAISTTALWGAAKLAPSEAYLSQYERVIESAITPRGLTPMLMATDIAHLLDPLCSESESALIQLAAQQDLRCGGVLSALVASAETVADAIKALLRYNCRHAEPLHWTGSMRGDHAAMTAWFDRPAGLDVHQSERMLVLGTLQLVAGFGAALGEAFKPVLIRVKASQFRSEWPEQFMGVPLESDATETELLIDRACLSLPNPRREALPQNVAIMAERERYQDLARADLLRNDTCSWIRAHLPQGDCDLTHLANRLNCDKRTLQRRFEKELSCRFSDLVDDVRAEICLPLLESAIFPTQTIAEQLGYATSGNFSRFFQRRFGCTPREWTRLSIAG